SSLTRSGTVVIVTVRVTGVYGACAALGKLPPLHATPATSVQAVAPIAVRRERCRDDMGGCPGLTLVTLRGARSAWRDLRQRCKRIKKGSSGISGKRRMDRGGTDRQSTTLMKTRTTRDTTDKAPIKKVLPEFPGNAARKGQRKQTNDCEAGRTGRVLRSRRRGQSRTQRAQPG